MDELSRQVLKQAINISDEDLERLAPGLRKLVSDLPTKAKWKIIAEVTESKYCFAGLKPGDKFVFNYPVLNIAESTATPCVPAIAALANHLPLMVDRVAEGVDPNDSIRAGQQFECPDVGLEHGGLGKVWFKLYAERRDPRQRIGLIACTKAKLSAPAPARELYSPSDLFRKAAAYCDAYLDGWFVLSAKYGLVEPDRIIEPYDVTLKTMPASERQRWGTQVAQRLRQLGDVALEAHAGAHYVRPLLEAGIVLDDPVRGLTIGKRKRWYIERLGRTKLAYHSQP